jgi:hypothetical protein
MPPPRLASIPGRLDKPIPFEQRLQPRPFRITQVMPLQPILIHEAIQAKPHTKIYGTRPAAEVI